MKKIIIAGLLLLIGTYGAHAEFIRSVSSGNWTNSATTDDLPLLRVQRIASGDWTSTNSQGDTLVVDDLRVEWLVDPEGIESERPRLSWVLKSGDQGESQTAFRILVADSRDALSDDHGNIWDSGRVNVGQSPWVAYDGKSLVSGHEYFWKVKGWGNSNGTVSEWSIPGRWYSFSHPSKT